MASTAPPPPPPPPPVLSTPTPLASSQRPSANRDNIGGVRPTQNPQPRAPFAGIHPEALQHAAASLRKTQYREPLLAPEPEPVLGRQTQLPVGGHRSFDAQHAWLQRPSPGTSLPVTYHSAHSSAPLGQHNGASLALNQPQQQPQQQQYTTTYTSVPAYNPINPTSPPPNPSFSQALNHSFNQPISAPQSTIQHQVQQQPQTTGPRIPAAFQQPHHLSHVPGVNFGPPSGIQPEAKDYSFSSGPGHQVQVHEEAYQSPPDAANQTTYSSYSRSETFNYPSNAPPQVKTNIYTYNPQQQKQSPHVYAQPFTNGSISNYSTQSKTYSSTATTNLNGTPTPKSNEFIANPQKYIYDFATKTPIYQPPPPPPPSQPPPQDEQHQYATPPQNQYQTSHYSSTRTTETSSNQTPKKPYNFAEELRDQGLTNTQRYHNQFQSPQHTERPKPTSYSNLYEENIRKNRQNDQIEEIFREMETKTTTKNTVTTNSIGYASGKDICAKCTQPIVADTPGVTALGRPYHVNCFSCDLCQKQLAGCSFYNVDGKNLCQVDYMNSLEKCEKCATPITQKILRALGKPYHPECFVCPACQKSLDGIPFTVNKENAPYCLDCYHERFSPRCAVCLKAIAPSANETEVARVIAMDKSYHVECYKCEDCGMQLNSKVEGAACYPLESHLFCKNCNLNRLKAIR